MLSVALLHITQHHTPAYSQSRISHNYKSQSLITVYTNVLPPLPYTHMVQHTPRDFAEAESITQEQIQAFGALPDDLSELKADAATLKAQANNILVSAGVLQQYRERQLVIEEMQGQQEAQKMALETVQVCGARGNVCWRKRECVLMLCTLCAVCRAFTLPMLGLAHSCTPAHTPAPPHALLHTPTPPHALLHPPTHSCTLLHPPSRTPTHRVRWRSSSSSGSQSCSAVWVSSAAVLVKASSELGVQGRWCSLHLRRTSTSLPLKSGMP